MKTILLVPVPVLDRPGYGADDRSGHRSQS